MDIRWNKERKQQQDEAHDEEKALVKKAKAISLVAKLYDNWKRKLVGTKKAYTKADVLRALYELQAAVGKKCDEEGLTDWKDWTMGLIDDKIAQVFSSDVTTNEVVQSLPSVSKDVPRRAKIESLEEFEALPWIAVFKNKPDFIGFLRDFPRIIAKFDDDDDVEVCTCSSEVGLLKYPTLAEFSYAASKPYPTTPPKGNGAPEPSDSTPAQ